MPSPTIPRASYRFQLKPQKCREAPQPPQKPLTWKALPSRTEAQDSRDALWCATASDIADKHVKSAFGGLKEALRGFRAEKMEKPQRSMPVILALAGTSANDHHATMCRARELLHQEVPKVCTALVRPRDFASLNAANRAIGEQLQGGDSSSQLQEAEADDEDECTAASSFVSCHSNSRCMTVLCIEAADAVPKQILKDVLAYWHENCMAAEIPIVAFLGLKRLKASRTELFDLGSEPGAFHHIQTVCLFDPEKVFHELLGRMKEVRCPLARTPAVQKSLRHIFQQFQQSVSHVLDMVCLLAAKDFNCSQESLMDAERHLIRKTEGYLRMLAAEEPHDGAAKDAGSPLRDTARVYQFLECSTGRQVKVADLWASCQKTMFASLADEVALPRFRQALATLHLMGIVFFVRGNAQKGVSGWHLKRRVFGRVWWYKEMSNFVKAGRSKISARDAEASPCRSLSRSESMSSSMSAEKSEQFATPKVPVSLEPGPGALLKRLPFPRVFDVEEGAFTTPQKKRARLQRIIHGPIDVN